ncbi:hypothetical protein XELAEV_18001734mg [Xenopus laevis]|nr:hypothetical protein XELAEV_18001734mg [Xenopus laevis]
METFSSICTSTKANSKTYEKPNKKNGKQQDFDTNSTSSYKPASPKFSLSDDYSLIAAEVARLINPVIETTISKAIDKLQIKISNISEKLSTHDKRFDYSLLLSQKRKEFSKTCDSLANLQVNFSLMYPAKLKIFLPSGARVFSDPGEAYTFTYHLEKKKSGNFAPVTHLTQRAALPQKIRDGGDMIFLDNLNFQMT